MDINDHFDAESPSLSDGWVCSADLSDTLLEHAYYFGVRTILTYAQTQKKFERANDIIKYFKWFTEFEPRRASVPGFSVYTALGITPGMQPRRLHPELWKAFPYLLKHPLCKAVGPVSLWEDTPKQRDLFERQVNFAQQINLPVVVEVPAKLPINMTYKMMHLLEDMHINPRNILWVGTDIESSVNILFEGYYVVFPFRQRLPLKISDFGLIYDQFIRSYKRLDAHGIDDMHQRLVLASYARAGYQDLLRVPKCADALFKKGINHEFFDQLTESNIKAFLGI